MQHVEKYHQNIMLGFLGIAKKQSKLSGQTQHSAESRISWKIVEVEGAVICHVKCSIGGHVGLFVARAVARAAPAASYGLRWTRPEDAV